MSGSSHRTRYERLLAKSPLRGADADHPTTLRKHTAMVLAAADALLDARGAASLRAVGLPPEWEGRLRRVVRLGAFVTHDRRAAHGDSVVVWYDYPTARSAPIPDDLRARLEALVIPTA